MEKEKWPKEKVCTLCKKLKPINEYYFCKKSRGVAVGYYHSWCKSCTNMPSQYKRENRRKYYDANRESFILSAKKSRNKPEIKKKLYEQNKINMPLRNLHRRIRTALPVPKYCQICGMEKRLDLASVGHVYSEELSTWKYLCRRCHKNFDFEIKNKVDMLKDNAQYGRKVANGNGS